MRPHEAYDDDKRECLLRIARSNSPKAYALIQLLYEGGLRIQDVVDIPFDQVLKAPVDARGIRKVKFKAKKSGSRLVPFTPAVAEAVEAYR